MTGRRERSRARFGECPSRQDGALERGGDPSHSLGLPLMLLLGARVPSLQKPGQTGSLQSHITEAGLENDYVGSRLWGRGLKTRRRGGAWQSHGPWGFPESHEIPSRPLAGCRSRQRDSN